MPDLSRFETMDPNLLPGLINTTLRNDHEDFDDLVKTHDLDREALLRRLKNLGYEYVAEVNQVRPLPDS